MDDDYSEVFQDEEYEGWVDIEGDVLRGVIVLQPEPDHLWVDNVAVDPESQGTRLGKTLLEFALERARELNLSEVRFFTHVKMTRNRAIYAQLGWAEYDEEKPIADYFVYFSKPVEGAGA